MLLAPLSELAVSQLWSPSQCFFGAEMTELGPTFKDNCLIGAFSYAVGSWGPEKGSDNSVIMWLQQIYAFVAELWRMSWQPCALSTSTRPPWTVRYSWSKAFFNKNTVEYLRVWLCEWVCIVRTHDCISQEMNEMSEYVWIHLGSRYSMSWKKAFIPATRAMSPIWKVEEPYYILHLLPSSTAPGYKVSDEVYLCKTFWGGTSHTWRQLSPEPFFFQRLGCQYNFARREQERCTVVGRKLGGR